MAAGAGDPLARLLARQGVAILDGGLATELERRGHRLEDSLWSARLLSDDPRAIRQLHFDYLDAGADCIVTASYQATVAGFVRVGRTRAEAEELLRRSVEIALAARDAFWAERTNRRGRQRPLVAASIGPYGAALADGSEYRGDYGLSEEALVRFHRERLALLAASGADLLACETIPSGVEARALTRLLVETDGPPAWLAFSCRDGERLRDGTPVAPLVADLETCPAIVALGVNCTAPGHVGALVRAIAAATRKPIVVYPNSGEVWDAVRRRWRPAPPQDAGGALAELAPGWREDGARLIGGCCRTSPADIRALRAQLLPTPSEP